MSDTVTVKAGAVVRIVTTGGGGWGDPLKREVDKVVYDVAVRSRLRGRRRATTIGVVLSEERPQMGGRPGGDRERSAQRSPTAVRRCRCSTAAPISRS